MATLRNHNAHRDIGFMTDRGETGKHIFSYQEQVTLPMNFSPLSVSPVGEMLVSIVNEKPLTVK